MAAALPWPWPSASSVKHAPIRSLAAIPTLARPAMDAFGVDIGKTVEPLGFRWNLIKKVNCCRLGTRWSC